jgi:hypothetical protein
MGNDFRNFLYQGGQQPELKNREKLSRFPVFFVSKPLLPCGR